MYFDREKSGHVQVSLDLMQAMLFNCIGLLHCESEEFQLAALSTFNELVALSRREKLLARSATSPHRPSEESWWAAWVQDEVRRLHTVFEYVFHSQDGT